MKIFSGSANKPLAENIARALQTQLSRLDIFVFPDGERRVRIDDAVVDQDAVVVQPTATPVDQNYVELFFIADGLKRSGARSVTAVIPYLGYQRQDHIFRDGEAVSLEVMAKTLQAVGINRIFAFDLHSIKIPEVFTIPLVHLSALPLFADIIRKNNWLKENTVLVSPDMGGIRRIKILSELLDGMSFAVVDKDRDLASGKVAAVSIDGELQDRAILVDDMISSGLTMVKAAELLRTRGVREIVAFATHAVFSSDAPQLLQESMIEKVYVTDSVFVSEEKKFPKLKIVSIAEMIAGELKK